MQERLWTRGQSSSRCGGCPAGPLRPRAPRVLEHTALQMIKLIDFKHATLKGFAMPLAPVILIGFVVVTTSSGASPRACVETQRVMVAVGHPADLVRLGGQGGDVRSP